MKAHLDALAARVVALQYPAHIVWATGALTYPYAVLSSPAWDSPAELPLCGFDTRVSFDVRVKVVAGTPQGVYVALERIRDDLSPGGRSSALAVLGRFAHVKFVRSEFVDVDESTTLTGTDHHPAFGVDTYRVDSQPA